MTTTKLIPNNSGVVVWITGLSGSGKTSLACAAVEKLDKMAVCSVVLDGDQMRSGLCSDLGFALSDRSENVRRVSEVARLFKKSGFITFVALISPIRIDRRKARSMFESNHFIEVWCRCPLEICEKRDGKNLYNRARKGEITEFTGLSSVYEYPEKPELIIDSEHLSVEDSSVILLDYLKNHGHLDSL